MKTKTDTTILLKHDDFVLKTDIEGKINLFYDYILDALNIPTCERSKIKAIDLNVTSFKTFKNEI